MSASRTVDARYDEWVRVLRDFIRKAEDQRALGAVEVAKALLLYGMKLMTDLRVSELSDHDRLTFVNEMRRRTAIVLTKCANESALRGEQWSDE